MTIQVVVVQATNTTLTYMWKGEAPLEIGDWVEVPANYYKTTPQVLQVVGIGSDYTGPITAITRKVTDSQEVPQ